MKNTRGVPRGRGQTAPESGVGAKYINERGEKNNLTVTKGTAKRGRD